VAFVVAVALVCATASFPADADLFGWFGKSSKTVRTGATIAGAAALRPLSQQEALALAAGAAVLVQIQGPKVVFQAISTGTHKVADLAGDVATLARTSLDEAIAAGGQNAGAKAYAMTRETATSLGEKLDDLTKAGRAYVIERELGALPVRLVRLPDGTIGRFREVRPGLVVALEEQLTEDVVQLLTSPVKTERIRVASLFDPTDADTVKRLADVAGDRLVDARAFRDPTGKIVLRDLEGGIVVAVGHVEHGSFVARRAAGGVSYRVSIAQLEAAADKAGATLLSAGCSCFPAGARAGFLGNVTDIHVAASIPTVLTAKTYADLLAAFGRPEAPFAITNSALAKLAEQQILEMARLARHGGKANTAAVSLRLMKPGQSSSELFAVARGWFIIGLVALALMFRMNRAAYLRLFPLPPAPQFSPVVSLIITSVRHTLFFIVAPFIGALVVFSFLFGFWSAREQAHEYFWSAFFRPVEFVVITLAGLGFVALWLGLLLAFVMLPIMLLFDPVFSARGYPSALVLALAVAAIPYGIAGWWMVTRFPDCFATWLMNRHWPRPLRIIAILAVAIALPVSLGMAFTTAGHFIQLARYWSAEVGERPPSPEFCAEPLLATVCGKGLARPDNSG
jgi:hypothetical protein